MSNDETPKEDNVVNLFGKSEDVQHLPTSDEVIAEFSRLHEEMKFDQVLVVGLVDGKADIGFGTSIRTIADINYLLDIIKNAIIGGGF